MVILSVIGVAWSLFLSFQSQTPGFSFARRASRRGRRLISGQSFTSKAAVALLPDVMTKETPTIRFRPIAAKGL